MQQQPGAVGRGAQGRQQHRGGGARGWSRPRPASARRRASPCSKMLAKLVSGMHKPNDQTLMLPPDAPAFVATLPVRAIPGVGYKLEKELARMGVQTANDLRGVPRAALLRELGERTGQYVFGACRGEDPTPVQQSGPPKSITVEDSFKSCTSLAAAQHVLRILAPDLLARLREDAEEHARRPGSMTLKWRLRAQGWARTSASCPMPVQGVAAG